MKLWVVLLGLVLGLSACSGEGESDTTSDQSGDVVARVGERVLTTESLQEVISPGLSPKDSAQRAEGFIRDWVTKQLLLEKAAEHPDIDGDQIEKRVDELRTQLLLHAYRQKFIEAQLDTQITEQSIEAYYKAHPEDFALKQHVLRGRYLKLPLETPRLDRVRSSMKGDKEADLRELRSYAFRFAEAYHLEDSLWVSFESLTRGTPLARPAGQAAQLLKSSSFVEGKDAQYVYLLRIEEYKITDQPSPLEFVRDRIENLLINKRKQELIQQMEKDLYQSALEREDVRTTR